VSEMIDDGNINKFLSSFAEIYPCKKCKSHFKKYVIDYPFRGNSGSDLNQYFCAFHNEVNKRLKKPLYNCKLIY
jgi:FAD-linked sulfhydryl oxidase